MLKGYRPRDALRIIDFMGLNFIIFITFSFGAFGVFSILPLDMMTLLFLRSLATHKFALLRVVLSAVSYSPALHTITRVN